MTLMPPGNATRLELDWLVCWLTKTSVRKGGIHTAQILDEFLTLSEAKALPAQEITLFLGLRVEQRFDFGKAAFIAPYEQVVEEELLTERNNAPWGESSQITTNLRLPLLSETSRGGLQSGLQ